jgi:hypothetical protein
MTSRLKVLVKRVIELHQARLEVCHCTLEFTLRWICPLGHWKELAFECPRLADPNCDPPASKILNHFLSSVLL